MKQLLFFLILCSAFLFSGCGSTGSVPAQNTAATTTISTQTTSVGYTMQDVQKHSTASDCRTVINGKIYNVSSFASRHSGGTESILSSCGKDSTATFTQCHGNKTSMIQQFFVAKLQ